MQQKELSLLHRDVVSQKLNAINIHLSEFCFPNLYFFRSVHEYKIIELSDSVFIEGISYDKKKYLMPLHAPSEDSQICFERVLEIMTENNYDCIFPIPEEWLCCFPDNQFNKSYNENDSDYLFLTEKMSSYAGKKMHKKRNLKNQFLNEYVSSSSPIGAENRKDAYELLEIWQNRATQEMETNDYGPCKEAIEDMEGFGLWGYLFYVEEKPVGFVLGEALNESTFTIHFAKADIDYKGVYAYIFSEFCTIIKDKYQYINMEQDLGKEGLRQTKRSFRPDLMAHKYRVELK